MVEVRIADNHFILVVNRTAESQLQSAVVKEHGGLSLKVTDALS